MPPLTIQTGNPELSFSYPAFDEFRTQNQALQSVFAFVPLGFRRQNTTVNVNGEPTLANGMMVTGGYFSGLGVTPIVGRAITEEDEQDSAPRVAVISYAYWTQRFARDPSIVGKNVMVNGTPFTIVGVAPPAFHGAQPGTDSDIWMAFFDKPNLRPWGMQPPKGIASVFTARNWICLNIMARLKPGVSQQQAEAALNAVFRRFLTSEWTPDKPDQVAHLQLAPAGQGLNEGLRLGYSQPLYLLMGIVGIVLLIACANLATLLLARATARQREISVRLAIGAGRIRLVRQLLTESILLAVIGGALGLLLANWGTHALLALMSSSSNPIVLNVKPDSVILCFTFLVSLCAGLLFGIAPAFRAVRVDLALAMKENAGNLFEGKGQRLGKSLVVVQVAASLVLTIGAGLFLRTLRNLENRDLGFNQNNLLLFALDPARSGYAGDRLLDFYSGLLERIQALPGVHATPIPKAYIPYTQMTQSLAIMYFEVRATGNPMGLVSSIRNVVHQADPSLPLMNLKTQVEQTGEALTQERLFARLSSFFGFLALLLASIGLCGTMAYSVTRKTREIGIRMALGARPSEVLREVVGQGIKLTLIGVIIGIVAAVALTRLIGSMIYGVTTTDPLTFFAGSALLVCIALLACYIPGRRAAKVDPMVALRYE